DSYDNGDFDEDPYDDDMYEGHDLSQELQAICDNLDTRVRGPWTGFKDLLQKVSHHSIDLWLQIQIFYDHVSYPLKRKIDQAVGGKLRDKSVEES
nr:zinc finger, CCHC-type [Tanacetum cinerariifolium]